jgi:hypothetical protein
VAQVLGGAAIGAFAGILAESLIVAVVVGVVAVTAFAIVASLRRGPR